MSQRLWSTGLLTIGALLVFQICAFALVEWQTSWALTGLIGICALGGVVVHAPFVITLARAIAPLDDSSVRVCRSSDPCDDGSSVRHQ
jgi:hypothetical protein